MFVIHKQHNECSVFYWCLWAFASLYIVSFNSPGYVCQFSNYLFKLTNYMQFFERIRISYGALSIEYGHLKRELEIQWFELTLLLFAKIKFYCILLTIKTNTFSFAIVMFLFSLCNIYIFNLRYAWDYACLPWELKKLKSNSNGLLPFDSIVAQFVYDWRA